MPKTIIHLIRQQASDMIRQITPEVMPGVTFKASDGRGDLEDEDLPGGLEGSRFYQVLAGPLADQVGARYVPQWREGPNVKLIDYLVVRVRYGLKERSGQIYDLADMIASDQHLIIQRLTPGAEYWPTDNHPETLTPTSSTTVTNADGKGLIFTLPFEITTDVTDVA